MGEVVKERKTFSPFLNRYPLIARCEQPDSLDLICRTAALRLVKGFRLPITLAIAILKSGWFHEVRESVGIRMEIRHMGRGE